MGQRLVARRRDARVVGVVSRIDTGVRGPRHGRQPVILTPDGTPTKEEFAYRLDLPPHVTGAMLVVWIPGGTWLQVISECNHGRRQHYHSWEPGDSKAAIISRHLRDHRDEVNLTLTAQHSRTPGTVTELCSCDWTPVPGSMD